MTVQTRKRFGELLIEENKIKEQDLQEALGEQQKYGQKLGQVLFKMGLLSEEAVAEILGRQLGIPVAKLDECDLSRDLVGLIPKNIARNCNVIPIEKHYNWIRVAMTDPLDLAAMDEVAHFLRLEVLPSIATESQINRALARYYSMRTPVEDIQEDLTEPEQEAPEPDESSEGKTAEFDEADPIEAIGEKFASLVSSDSDKLLSQRRRQIPEETPFTSTAEPSPGDTDGLSENVSLLISQALSVDATDIHLQADLAGGHVRMRVDGELRMMESLHDQAPSELIGAVKKAAGLESLEGMADGRFDFSQDVSVRVSACPIASGQKAVLRLVDKRLSSTGLDGLGIPSDIDERLKKALRQTKGLFLCSGPVGGGKTTTLYGMLNYLNAKDKAVVTVEDPIEYVIDHVAQVDVGPASGFTLSQRMRTVLRQDPDVCAVGEIGDHESASLALQAGLAGVTVLATFCWNDAIGALTRLIQMGIEPSLLASSVVCVIGQCLVRKICEGCKETYRPPQPILESINIHETAALYRGNGCPVCRNTGYRGRTAVYEFLFLDDELRSLVAAAAPRAEIEKAALAGGMRTMRENGIAKALLGITTLEEALNRTKPSLHKDK